MVSGEAMMYRAIANVRPVSDVGADTGSRRSPQSRSPRQLIGRARRVLLLIELVEQERRTPCCSANAPRCVSNSWREGCAAAGESASSVIAAPEQLLAELELLVGELAGAVGAIQQLGDPLPASVGVALAERLEHTRSQAGGAVVTRLSVDCGARAASDTVRHVVFLL